MTEAEAEALPVDLATMRDGAARILGRGAEPLSDEDLERLRLQLRGHIEVLIPAVERAAARRPKGHGVGERALRCASEARVRLRLGRGDTLVARVSVVAKLACSVRTLCGHLETLGGVRMSRPLDAEAMRASTARVLADDAELPTVDELHDLTLLYRGHLMVLIPEVEKATCGLPKDDVATTGALAGVTEARTRLDVVPGARMPRQVAHAQRLARSVDCLLGHLENLGGELP